MLSCVCLSLFVKSSLDCFSPANCSDPTVPKNGSVEVRQNTTEGAQIHFRCNPGFVPAGRTRAVCARNGRWNPDPGDITCTGRIETNSCEELFDE